MPTELSTAAVAENVASHVFDYIDDELIEDIWHDLGRQFTQEQIRQIVVEVAAEFQDAAVTSFIPIFIRRRTRERLKIGLDERNNAH